MTKLFRVHDDRTDEDVDLEYQVDDLGHYKLQPSGHSLLDLVSLSVIGERRAA